jgi:hypothetical protein
VKSLEVNLFLTGFKQFGTTVHQGGGGGGTNMGQRQFSVVSDSCLLDDEIKQEVKVILRPKRPPRPQSEVFLDKVDGTRRSKRYSAFGVRFFAFAISNQIWQAFTTCQRCR